LGKTFRFPLVQTFYKTRVRFYTWSVSLYEAKGRFVGHLISFDEVSDDDGCTARNTLLTMNEHVLTRPKRFVYASTGFIQV